MRLLHMFNANLWLETTAIQPKYAYVYWGSLEFEEHVSTEDIYKYPRVPIGTNPFNKGS